MKTNLLTSDFKIPPNIDFLDYFVDKYYEVHEPFYTTYEVIPIVKQITRRLSKVLKGEDIMISSGEFDILRISGTYNYSLYGLITRLLFDENLVTTIFKTEHLKRLLTFKEEIKNTKFDTSAFLNFDKNDQVVDDNVVYHWGVNDIEHPSYRMYEEILNTSISLSVVTLLKLGLLNENCQDYSEWIEPYISRIKEMFEDESAFVEYFNL